MIGYRGICTIPIYFEKIFVIIAYAKDFLRVATGLVYDSGITL